MKTVIIKSVMLVFIVIGLVHYALYLKTGRLPWAGWQGPQLSLPASLPSVGKLAPSSKTEVYKWVDENGVVNYSQEPPPANTDGQVLVVDANTNVIQGIKLTQESPAAAPASVLIGDSAAGGNEKTPIEKAQEAKALLEARDRAQKSILDSL